MKAVVYTQYGPPDVLMVKEIEKPTPADNEILVKVHATTVNRTDNATTKAIPFIARLATGLFNPKKQTPGTEFAGVVEDIGKAVTAHKLGDRVFGFDDMGSGAQAEYLTIREECAVTIPEGVDFEKAAASSEGAHYAYNFINKVKLQPGQNALVYGASGAIGSAAVQLLKAFDIKVTAVCGTRNLDLVKSLGADKVIDYTKQDFTQDGERYDYILDAVGKSSLFKCWPLMEHGAVYSSSDLGFMGQNIFLPLITPVIKPLLSGRKTIFPMPTKIPTSLALLQNLMRDGKFNPVIDRRYPLDEIVEAYRYVEQGHKTGNVVINVS
ncbi:MAG: NAD(P)-dependent alcohol dehydrogenase [Gammaproteobacteria bacterium]|nr:NAD(P)-dependent alcohol dehydrogenase [Gammaproteobacteria bacterium]